MITIYVTWMDGREETYRPDSYRVEGGELLMQAHNQPEIGVRSTWHIPLGPSVRGVKVQQK